MVDRARPVAAITGTYFCTRTGFPIGTIVAGGQRIHTGGVGTVLAFEPKQDARLLACQTGQRRDWFGYETVLRAGPRLLADGQEALAPAAEGFRDPAIFQRKPRTAVAVTRLGKLLLVATQKPVLLRTLAAALRELGAVDAMCLDGGGSTGLYHCGKTAVRPNRPLTNLLVVYESQASYQKQQPALNPGIPPVHQATRLGAARQERRGS